MIRWKVILAAAVIFASGVVTGWVGFNALQPQLSPPTTSEDQGPPPFRDPRSDMLQRLQRDLELTPEQSARIDVILQEGRKRTRQLWEQVSPQMREETRLVRESIQAELTPEQRVQYDEILKRRRSWGSRSEGDGPRDSEGRRGPRSDPPPHDSPKPNPNP